MQDHIEEFNTVQLYIRQIIDPMTVKYAVELFHPRVEDPKSVELFLDMIVLDATRNFLVGNNIRVEENGTKIFNVCPIPIHKYDCKADIILGIAHRGDKVRIAVPDAKVARHEWLFSTPYTYQDVIDFTIIPKTNDPYPRW